MGRESRTKREKRARTQALQTLRAEMQQSQAAPGHIVRHLQASTRSGPIPSAEELQEYGALDPDLPMRIVGWVDTEGAHRREMEKLAVQAEVDGAADLRVITKLGQAFGLILGLSAIAGGVLVAWFTGDGISGAGLGAVGLASLIWGPRRGPKSPGTETQE